MAANLSPDVTGLLERIRADDPDAMGELVCQLYGPLRNVAARLLSNEPPGHTLQATALVHEAFRRLLESGGMTEAADRGRLFASIHKAMRWVLVDHARRRISLKRGRDYQRVPLDDVLEDLTARWSLSDSDLIAIHQALELLEQRSGRQRVVVDMKIVGCMKNHEVARELGVSEGTVERDFRLARAFLSQQLAGLVPQ